MNNINLFIKRILDNHGRGWSIGKIVKTVLIIVVALFALYIVLAMFKWVFGIGGNDYHYSNGMDLQQVFSEPEMLLDYADEMIGGGLTDKFNIGFVGTQARSAKMMAPTSVSVYDVMPTQLTEHISKDAEDFETRSYSANYEERNISKVCNEIESLKPLEYVIFSNANKNDTYCNYTFKVEVEKEDEIITLIKSLNPKSFNASTFTLERIITNNNNEVEILEKKLKMLDSLLTSAQAKYASLRNTGNATALVQAINNEINLIERITNQKLNVQSQIDRLTNSTGVQTERINYSQFNVSVSERKFINWSNIGEQWKFAFERFISGISEVIQDLTIGLVMFVLGLVKFIMFLSVGVVAIVATSKFLWSIVRKIWKI